MSEASVRNATRTPNIFQNVELSSSQSAKMTDTTLSPGATKNVPSAKMQTLRQRKTDLDKLLIEKNNILQELCRAEAKILANCSVVANDIGHGIDCGDGHPMNAALRRRVDTSFKLPENLLNSKEDEINKYLLSKQIQQQISEASLKLANDMTQTKSIRRAHRQNYEVAQQKLMTINQSLGMLKKRMNIDAADSINNNNMIIAERRNSTISNTSSQQSKIRTRCDSYSGMSSNAIHSNGNLSPSTMSGGSYYMLPHLHYSNHNHLAEKVVYVTNAVAAAAAEAKNNANASSPKHGRLRNPLTVDTSDRYHYPSASSAGAISYPQRQSQPPPLSYQHPTSMHEHSPYHSMRKYPDNGTVATMMLNKRGDRRDDDVQLRRSPHHQEVSHQQRNNRSVSSTSIGNASDDDDDDDDIAGQYATLLTLTQKPSIPPPVDSSMVDDADSPEPETHYSVIKKPPPSSSATLPTDSTATNTDAPKHQGLGGYWTTSENNERIWCSIDNRYSSLDRKSQKNKIKKTISRSTNHPIKSTSLGNFNFLNKPDEILDAISISSVVSDQRKIKEKQWTETSLDTPVTSPQPISPPIYYRDKQQQQPQQSQPLSPPYYHHIQDHGAPSVRHYPANGAHSAITITKRSDRRLCRSKSRQSPRFTEINGQTSATLSSATDDAVILMNRPASEMIHSTANAVTNSPLSPAAVPTTPNDSFTYQNNSTISNSSLSQLSDIHIESPKNMTIIQQAKFQPYKEVTKPFEMSDFYKYSTKFRQKNTNMLQAEQNSPQLPPKNENLVQKHTSMPSYTVHNQ